MMLNARVLMPALMLAAAAAAPVPADAPPVLRNGKKRRRRYYDPGTRPFAENHLKRATREPAPRHHVLDDDGRAALARAQAKRERKAAQRRKAALCCELAELMR